MSDEPPNPLTTIQTRVRRLVLGRNFTLRFERNRRRLERQALSDLIGNDATAEEICASDCIRRAKAEMSRMKPTINDGVIPPDAFWSARQYKDGRNFEQMLTALEAKAIAYARGCHSERRAIVLIGPPACGKSGIAEKLAVGLSAAIVDADDAKAEIVEFQNGLGSSAVHAESGLISTFVQARLIKQGRNLILPKIGRDPGTLRKQLTLLRQNGYKVLCFNVRASDDECFRRMAHRFLRTGRIVDPDYLKEAVNLPSLSYNEMKSEGAADGFAEIDTEAFGSEEVVEQEGDLWPELKGHGLQELLRS